MADAVQSGKVEQFWATPVGIFDLDPSLNDLILQGLAQNPTMKSGDDLFKSAHPGIVTLKKIFEENANKVLHSHFPQRSVRLRNGWANRHSDGDFLPPHSHGLSLVAGAYYALAPEGAGDLLLQDPSAGSRWCNYTDGMITNVVFKRIKPVQGRMVLFPGHIIHSTAPTTCKLPRISIAANFAPPN